MHAASSTEETEVICPYCGEKFTIVIDRSVDEQTYVEDCYVCCKPIEFSVVCDNGEVVSIDSDRS